MHKTELYLDLCIACKIPLLKDGTALTGKVLRTAPSGPEEHHAHRNVTMNPNLDRMDSESGMNVGTYDGLSGFQNTFHDELYGKRTVSGTAQFAMSNSRDDPEEQYANDNVMENENLDGMDGEYGTNVDYGAM